MKKTSLFTLIGFSVLTVLLIGIFLIPVLTAPKIEESVTNNKAQVEKYISENGQKTIISESLSANGGNTADDDTQKETSVESSSSSVMNLYKNSTESDSITVFWDKVDGASGYKVYLKKTGEDDDYNFIATTRDTNYTISSLDSSTLYSVKVTAVFDVGPILAEGEATTLDTATNPDGIGAVRLVRSSSVIGFRFAKVENATCYQIYRMCYKDKGQYNLYDTIDDPNITEYEDKNVEYGRAYYYKVRAVLKGENGMEYNGEFSDFKAVCGLSAPTLQSVTSQLRRVSFVWSSNELADGYDIYYSKTADEGFTLLGTTKELFFNTPRLENGVKYYFRLAPYRLVGDQGIKVIGSWDSVAETATTKAFSVDCGDTYIEVSREQQRMWYYVDGELFETTPVVTGNFGSMDTPKGCYKIFQRMSPALLRGADYTTPVTYWLGFTADGCGIHDSNWRGSKEYGGSTYVGNGSHGCVNTPIESCKKIYDKATIGTYVVVY